MTRMKTLELVKTFPLQDQPWLVEPRVTKGNPDAWDSYCRELAHARREERTDPEFKIVIRFVYEDERYHIPSNAEWKSAHEEAGHRLVKACTLFLGHFAHPGIIREFYSDPENISGGINTIGEWSERVPGTKPFDVFNDAADFFKAVINLTPEEILQARPWSRSVGELPQMVQARKVLPMIIKDLLILPGYRNRDEVRDLLDEPDEFRKFIDPSNWSCGPH